MEKNIVFNNIHEGTVNDKKSIVVSECTIDGNNAGYSIAVMKKYINDGVTVTIPMKGTIRADNVDELRKVGCAILEAVNQIQPDENEDW